MDTWFSSCSSHSTTPSTTSEVFSIISQILCDGLRFVRMKVWCPSISFTFGLFCTNCFIISAWKFNVVEAPFRKRGCQGTYLEARYCIFSLFRDFRSNFPFPLCRIGVFRPCEENYARLRDCRKSLIVLNGRSVVNSVIKRSWSNTLYQITWTNAQSFRKFKKNWENIMKRNFLFTIYDWKNASPTFWHSLRHSTSFQFPTISSQRHKCVNLVPATGKQLHCN